MRLSFLLRPRSEARSVTIYDIYIYIHMYIYVIYIYIYVYVYARVETRAVLTASAWESM